MQIWDVVVVGSGAAGLSAAWHARDSGANVLVLNKGLAGRTGATITSGGGVSIAGTQLIDLGLPGDPDDTEDDFFADTVRSGQFLGDQRLVRQMVAGIKPELKRLFEAGAPIKIMKRAPGHSSGRGVRIAGPDMQRFMTSAAVKAGARFREDFQSAGLLSDGNRVVGIAGIDKRGGTVEAIEARSVILATGGTTSNWRLRTAPEELTGDGHAMALQAGAELLDMEMLQFLPCCLVAPEIWRGLQFPWILGPQNGIRAWLLNRYGERFMARWDPRNMELATRDVVSAAMATEVLEGRGSPNGGVYISWAHLPRDIIDNFPGTISRAVDKDWHWEGFDMKPLIDKIHTGAAIEVAPAAHFTLGGIRIDTECGTGVEGLFACGEAAGGLHGGNRLSGNAGAQILVQGRVAGQAAARAAKSNGAGGPARNWEALRQEIEAPLHRRDGLAPIEIKKHLATLAETALGPVRNGAALSSALAELRQVRADDLPRMACRSSDPGWNRDWSEALECSASALVIEAALVSAIERTSSLGAHRRHDDPGPNGKPLHHGLVGLDEGRITYRSEPVEFPLLAPA